MQNVCRDWMSSGYAGEIALRSHKGARARSRAVGVRTMASCVSHRVLRALAREILWQYGASKTGKHVRVELWDSCCIQGETELISGAGETSKLSPYLRDSVYKANDVLSGSAIQIAELFGAPASARRSGKGARGCVAGRECVSHRAVARGLCAPYRENMGLS